MSRFLLDWRCKHFIGASLESLVQPSNPFYLKGIRWILCKLVDLRCSANNYISGIPDNDWFDTLSICIKEPSSRNFEATFVLTKTDIPRYTVKIEINSSYYRPLDLTITNVNKKNVYESENGKYKVMLNSMENQCIISKMFEVLIDFINSDHQVEAATPHHYTLQKG